MGRVYWITGLSNSGKTTIGSMLYYELRKSKENVVILDGDLMKEIASGTQNAQYSNDDRLIRAKRYSQMAKLLADQGMWVIVCAIAMFDGIRDWNRKHIKGYIEVFLNTPDKVLRARDRKGLYRSSDDVEYPKNPDLVFSNDGEESLKTIVERIMCYEPKNEDDYDRDRYYWNTYYIDCKEKKEGPSDFAVTIEKELERESHILELGCGNGRDSLYFLNKGHRVTAIDGSDTAIDMLKAITSDCMNAIFVCDDFVKCESLYQVKYDCIYSRFTLHAITEEQENELLEKLKGALALGGRVCIEARTVHDGIFGLGKKVDRNAFYYNGHFRRFIDVENFKEKIEKMGFKVLSLEESTGFSKTADSDPVLMRCIFKVNE